jgi:hypothetical protein
MTDLNEFAKRHARKLQLLHNPVLLHHIDIQKASTPILQAIQGRMLKKPKNIFKGWLPKHVILKNKILKYYNIVSVKTNQILPLSNQAKDEGTFRDNSDGFINFDSYDCRVVIEKQEITLTIKGASR